MNNDKNVELIEGRWYLVIPTTSNPRLKVSPIEIAMKYTKSLDDAYYVSHLFGSKCNVEVVCMLQEV